MRLGTQTRQKFPHLISAQTVCGVAKLPIQWTSESVSQGLKRMGYEPITHFHLLPRVRTLVEVQIFARFPIHFNDVVIYSAEGKKIPVYVQSKALVCGRSIAGIACSNDSEGMDVGLLRLLCVVR